MLELKKVSFKYHNQEVLKNVFLSLNKNEIVAILGESGAGKTTLLNLISGLIEMQQGEIYLNGVDIKNVSCEKRNIGVIFQDYALFPHLTVEKNILFGMKDKSKLVEMMTNMEVVHLKNKYPHEISGGEAQRVAIARSIAANPKLLLLDEPFSNLNIDLKQRIQKKLLQLHKLYNIPMIVVTHDIKDAYTFANRVYELKNNVLHEVKYE